MRSHVRAVIGSVVGVAVLMIITDGLHVGGGSVLTIGRFSPLLGAFIGGTSRPCRSEPPLSTGRTCRAVAWT